MKYRIEGNIADIHHRELFQGSIEVENGVITAISRHPTAETNYILPGFIDAHVHIESSMLTPEQFGKLVVKHGTVAIVTDPHEIANVMGVQGIEFMVNNSRYSPIKNFFTIPSCVPSTPFDRSGGVVTPADVEQLAASGRFVALSEMMNVPGVLSCDKDVLAKIASARSHSLPIDGHAPTLTNESLRQYAANHISTDHECTTLEEAKEKIAAGMKILIREGSAARNYETLKPLIRSNPDDIMFCTDDSHPDEIIKFGHIDKLVRRAVANDHFDLFDVLRIASINPIKHYKLDVGELRTGDKADFILVDNLTDFNTQAVYINGVKQYDRAAIETDRATASLLASGEINNFCHDKIEVAALRKRVGGEIDMISLVQDELLTRALKYTPKHAIENLESDIAHDILKIVYINRYNNAPPQVAYCNGFRLKQGAFASSIAHDSHNILAVGCSDRELCEAINAVIAHKGGLAVYRQGQTSILPLPIGGIMSDGTGTYVAARYEALSEMIREMGCNLHAPFMTLSFLSLIVIPELKIGEQGLFSYEKFNWLQ